MPNEIHIATEPNAVELGKSRRWRCLQIPDRSIRRWVGQEGGEFYNPQQISNILFGIVTMDS